MERINAVTFDLWQTLLLDNRETGRVRANLRLEGAKQALEEFGEPVDWECLNSAYQDCYQRCHEIRQGGLDVSFEEQVAIFVNHIRPGLAQRLPREVFQEVARVYADSFLVHPPQPHPDALQVLQGVQDLGLRIGLISNTGMTPGVTFRQFLEHHGMLKFFAALTFSDEVKVSKPSGEIFFMTMRELRVRPGESVHVGDHVRNDVVGAKRCGLSTVWIQGFSERADPEDPDSEPDAAVPNLGLALPAIERLVRWGGGIPRTPPD